MMAKSVNKSSIEHAEAIRSDPGKGPSITSPLNDGNELSGNEKGTDVYTLTTAKKADETANVLRGIPRDQLAQDVEQFAIQYDLQEALPLLQNGALLAQNPHAVETMPELSDTERRCLQNETSHRWKQSKTLYFTIVLNSIAAAVQGWDVTGSNGANLSFPEAFGINDTGSACTAAGTCLRNSWLIGVINAFPFITIGLL